MGRGDFFQKAPANNYSSKTFLASFDVLKLGLVDCVSSADDGHELLGDNVDYAVSLREEVLLKLVSRGDPVA